MLDKNQKFLRGLCHNIIDEKKFELPKQKDAPAHDILTTIMRTNEFSDSELVDQMLTFLAAGVRRLGIEDAYRSGTDLHYSTRLLQVL